MVPMAKEADIKKKQLQENYIQAILLAEVVKRILVRKAEIRLSAKPTLTLKPLVEFRKRMRISSIEKFPVKTYVSVINFYQNREDEKQSKVLGALIIYIPENFIIRLFEALNYPELDEDDEVGLDDACGTFCNLVAGNFKSGLTQLGFDEPLMSHFSSFHDEAPKGVTYPRLQQQYYEIGFEVMDQKCIVADLVMGSVRRIYSI